VTADRRLRTGGWAALLAALASPLRVVALWFAAGSSTSFASPDPWSSPLFLWVDLARVAALLVAIGGLDAFFRRFEAATAPRLLALGGVGAGLALVADAAVLAGLPRGGLAIILGLVGEILIAAWFLGGGLVLLRAGRQWARIGWTACLGGGVGVTGTALIDWFLLLGLFVIVYLVRVWRYVVGGRLPGPGIL
jgi:hypothetical protein